MRYTVRRSSIAAVAVLTLPATGCISILFNDCSRESRLETTIADLIDQTGALVGSAHFTISERRGDENERNVQLVLAGPHSAATPGGPLRGHITAVVLAEAADAFRYNIPILPPSPYGVEIFAPAGIHVGAAEYAQLRQATIDGRLRLYVETSPEVPAVRDVSFPAARAGEWQCPVYT